MRDAPADRRIDRPSAATVLLAAASVMAGLIHAAVTPEHLVEAWVFGAFFALAAGFQLGWAIAVIVRPSPGVYATGALANMALNSHLARVANDGSARRARAVGGRGRGVGRRVRHDAGGDHGRRFTVPDDGLRAIEPSWPPRRLARGRHG